MPLTIRIITAVNSISTVSTTRVHFSDVKKLAELTTQSTVSGKELVTKTRLRFSHQSMMMIRKGNRHKYRNRLAGGDSFCRTSMRATDKANE